MPSIALRIYNFPPIFTSVDVREFLHLFGLETVRFIKRRNVDGAIVSVANDSEARLVIARLHQLLIRSHRLKVEYATGSEPPVDAKPFQSNALKDATRRKAVDAIQEAKCGSLWGEGFPPPQLSYRYPKSSPEIVQNISKELAANQGFYYQTLHLMNKMNLQPPFESCKETKANAVAERVPGHVSVSEEESELESDTERSDAVKRKSLLTPHLTKLKVVNYSPATRQAPVEKKPKLEIHISGSSLNASQNSNDASAVHSMVPNSNESTGEQRAVLTVEDILRNQIPEEQRKSLNVFQNYKCGEPSNKLYIKNLAKPVTEQDLGELFGIFFEEKALKTVDVKLMKTGRMKGQAFVSFVPMDDDNPSAEHELKKCIATALSATNGFILKDKPMVVSYAKSTGVNNT